MFLLSRLLLVLLLLSTPSHSLFADAASDRRVRVGLNLFRTFVATDMSLEQRTTVAGKLRIVVLYVARDHQAKDYLLVLQQSLGEALGDTALPLELEVLPLEQLLKLPAEQMPASAFVAERLDDNERQQLVNFAIQHRIAVFSPFEGDVENGILGGLSVTASVKPAVNLSTMKASRLAFKRFYLSVARLYE
ncbi:hypothetical protein [Oceanobacter mangrovi]|uniref:hypothetical protein n=1 Tax=Oceanobacter mangrovi TaxID=2862510 RepID=UPI001C8F089D|nr:hypothetical protein [Oceanobacter mangrovi]